MPTLWPLLEVIANDQLPSISNMVWWYVSCPTSSKSKHDTLRHFCEFVTLYTLLGYYPENILNWLIPALVNISVGPS